MKKFLFFSLIALAALTVSCKKDNKDIIDDEPDAPKVERFAQLRDKWDWWDFSYNADGKVVKIDRGNGDRVWNFAWNGNNCEVTGKDTYSIELGSNGMVSKLTAGSDVRTYTYDANGYLKEVKLGDNVVATITVTNGNITKVVEGEDTWDYTYGSEDNSKGYQIWYQDRDGNIIPSWHRFLIETGMFGKASAKLPTSYSKNGTKVADYVIETSTGAQEAEKEEDEKAKASYLEGNYTIVTGDVNEDEIHKYIWAEL